MQLKEVDFAALRRAQNKLKNGATQIVKSLDKLELAEGDKAQVIAALETAVNNKIAGLSAQPALPKEPEVPVASGEVPVA